MVYFIKLENYVKIGYTDNLNRRINKMRADSPYALEVINCIDGDENTEFSTHMHFKGLHHRGDWFNYSDEMRTILKVDEATEDRSKFKKIKCFKDKAALLDRCQRMMENREFISKETLNSGYGLRRYLDTNAIKKYNKSNFGFSNYKNYVEFQKFLEIYPKVKRIKELTGILGTTSTSIVKYKKLYEKYYNLIK